MERYNKGAQRDDEAPRGASFFSSLKVRESESVSA
jgi:hypothetical protein